MSLLLISRRRYSGVEATPLDVTLADDLNNLDDAFNSEIGIHFHVNLEDDLNNFNDVLVKQGQHFLSELSDNLNNWSDVINVNLAAGGSDIVMDGLVAWYKFDEGSGQVLTDYSGNANHGQLGSTAGSDTNDPTWITSPDDGLLFDAIDNYVLLPALMDPSTTDFTVIIAIIFDQTELNKSMVSQAGGVRWFWNNSAEQLRTSLGAGFINTINLVDTLPYIGIITLAGTTVSISINTANKQSGTITPASATGILHLGVNESLAQFWSGGIFYLLFYDRALTDEEVTQNYNAIKAEKPGLSLP